MNLIAQLDDYCLQHDDDWKLPSDYRTGPFGVFEAKRTKTSTRISHQSTTESLPSGDSADSVVNVLDITGDDDTDPFEIVDSQPVISIPQDPPSNESSVEEIEHIRQPDLFGNAGDVDLNIVQAMPQNDFWQMDDPFSFMGDFGLTLDMPGGDIMDMDPFGSGPSGYPLDSFAGLFDINGGAVPDSSKPPYKTHDDWAHLLVEAPSLLRTYQKGSDTSEPAKQSFWKSFVLPSAMRTFADLSVFGKASDVSSSVFYSTLANSAFAMQRSEPLPSDDSLWLSVGKSAEEAAQYYFQSAMRSEAPEADCQELLSATLSIALVSVSRPCHELLIGSVALTVS